MKTGVYSLLFAITFLYESGTLLPVNAILGSSLGAPSTGLSEAPDPPAIESNPEVPKVPTLDSVPGLPSTCLINALINSSQLLLRTGILICMYDHELEALDDDNFEAFYEAVMNTLHNTLCTVDDVLNTAATLKGLGTPTSELVKIIVEQLRPILDKAGLSQPLMETTCGLLSPALTLDCLPALIAEDLLKLILDMKLHACQGQKEELFYEDVTATLKRLGCMLKCPGGLPKLPPIIKPTPLPAQAKPVIEQTPVKILPTPTIKPSPVPSLHKVLRKRDLEEPILPPNVNAPVPVPDIPDQPLIPQGGPKDPVIKITCMAVELLLKNITPV